MPNWRFFGPTPGVDDSHLFYRDLDENESPSCQWQEIKLDVTREWHRIVWNPGSRGPKAMADCIQGIQLAAMRTGRDFDAVKTIPQYKLLSRYVTSSLPHREEASFTQFILIRTRPQRSERVVSPVLTSELIPLIPHNSD